MRPAHNIKTVEHNPLADNVKGLLAREKVSESSLARALHLPYNTIKRITAGDTLDPKISTLQLIANYFDVTIDQLLSHNPTPSPKQTNSRSMCVPILSWEAITDPSFINDLPRHAGSKWQPIVVSANEPISDEAYALESKKSMFPRFPLGTILVVDPHEKPIDGDVVLVRIRDTNEVTIRDLVIDPPHWQLQPINRNVPTMSFETSKHDIIGVVVLTMLNARS